VSEPLARDLARMGIRDERVLRAIAATPRRLFVPEPLQDRADGDHPLPIGYGQTISQPFMVAWMTEALALTGAERVLEIGAGSGYQAAVLSRLCRRVFSLEIVPELAARARTLLAALGIENVDVRLADGTRGLPEKAPFDRIIVTAAAPAIPAPLIAHALLGCRLGRDDTDHAVCADARPAIGQPSDLVGCHVARAVEIRDQHEVVLGAVAFGEMQLACVSHPAHSCSRQRLTPSRNSERSGRVNDAECAVGQPRVVVTEPVDARVRPQPRLLAPREPAG